MGNYLSHPLIALVRHRFDKTARMYDLAYILKRLNAYIPSSVELYANTHLTSNTRPWSEASKVPTRFAHFPGLAHSRLSAWTP